MATEGADAGRALLASSTWSGRATKHVTAWQERAYGQLAERSGLGWNPTGMFALLTAHSPSVDMEALRAATPPGQFTDEEWEEIARDAEQCIALCRDPEPVTPFTHAGLQMTDKFAVLTAEIELAKRGVPLPYRPRVTTLPTGDFNARTRRIVGTDEAALMFDHTLLHFINEYAYMGLLHG